MSEPEKNEKLVRGEELSAEAHAALWYAMASLPENHPRWKVDPNMPRRELVLAAYQRGLDLVKQSGETKRSWQAAVQRGLRELLEHRVIDVRSDGHLGYEVVDVDPGRIEAGSILLTM